METKKRWQEIDALYAIGIILVLIGHSHSSDWAKFDHTVLKSAIYFIYTFHMALFFFISGFLFQNSDSIERLGFGRWIGDKALRLLTPYLVLSYLALFPKYWVEHHGFTGLTLRTVLDTVFVPRLGVWGHFWFLPVLFLSYVLFGMWRTLCRKENKRWMIVLAVTASLLFYFLPIRTEVFGLADLRSMLVFFAVGIAVNEALMERKYDGLRGRVFLICLALALVITIVSLLLTDLARKDSLVGLLVALGMIFACWCYASVLPKGKPVKWLSNHNFTIYIFSWLFQSVMMAVCDHFGFNWIVTFCLMFLTGLAGPALVILIYDKCTFLHHKFFRLVCGIR
ncbi:MAG: acyltransferase [Clostridia bacterium]|nr:acyltransferase [Clostridia bacterium]